MRPAIFGSYVASISSSSLEHGVALAEAGLRANPSGATLWNNIAVIKAYLGDIDSAHGAFQHSISGQSELILTPLAIATSGFIDVRSGNVEKGIARYLEAAEKANRENDPITALRAYSFLGREVSRIDPGVQKFSSSQLEKAISEFEKKQHRRSERCSPLEIRN